jgi:hypothetical protein
MAAAPAVFGAQAGKIAEKAAPARFEEDVKPVLAKYCYGCHGNAKKKGDLSLETFSTPDLAKTDPNAWEKVMQKVSSRDMPPEDKPQPTVAQRNLIVSWIADNLFPCDCDHPDPGRVTIRRLNRAEYNNTIRDLVGLNFKPAEDFPADDVGYGFDNIGDVLSMPTLLLEKYLAAAEKILDQAIVTDPNAGPAKLVFAAAELPGSAAGAALSGGARQMRKSGDIYATVKFPRDGDYVLRAAAYQDKAGAEPARMAFVLDGEEIMKFDVENSNGEARTFETTVKAKPGIHRFAVQFVNAETVVIGRTTGDNPKPRLRDRRLIIERLETDGPYHAGSSLPETHQRILVQRRPAEPDEAYTRRVISRFAFGAYRRPPTMGEIERLTKLADLARRQGDTLEKGVQVALEAVLVSPTFLFRGEIDRPAEGGQRVWSLNDYELAARLSYFLWSSMPDQELFDLARLGLLHERRVLEGQTRRMLKDAKARALVENFAAQWLQIRNLSRVSPDPKRFQTFDDSLRTAMRTETDMFVESILRGDRSVLEMIDADYTFVNGPLAKLYGLNGVEGDQFQRVSLKTRERGGLMTQASVLTVTSNPTRTSPVKRGRWVLDNILGTPPPSPPANVPPLKEATGSPADESLRDRMKKHRENPSCASCHSRMDPIGFGLENFDAVGAWRTRDGKFPVDASGVLPDGTSFSGPAELKGVIMSRKDDFCRCLAEKLLTYALGRGLEYYDKCAVDRICESLRNNDYRFSALVTGIAESVPFQMRKGESEKHATQMAVE